MADKQSKLTARTCSCYNYYRLVQVCNRTRQRRHVWLGFITVAAVTMLFLPFKLHARTLPTVVTPAGNKPTTESIRGIIRDIEARLETNITNIHKNEYYFASKSLLNGSEGEVINSRCEQERVRDSKVVLPTVTLILSLYNILSEAEALLYIRQNLQHILNHVSDDVIITAEDKLPGNMKDQIEEVVDLCSSCRLFFFSGNVYKHRNEAAKFARNKYLLFVDARIQLSKDWLQPLLRCLQDNMNLVVSPQLRIRYADDSGQNEGVSRNEITWDLGVSRAAVDDTLLELALSSGLGYIQQTIISTEVFGIHKQFFTDLAGFDVIPGTTGAEHVAFSLKVWNCKGNIGTSPCSSVFYVIPNAADTSGSGTSIERAAHAEFRSPTFSSSQDNMKVNYIAASRLWLDEFTTRYFMCSMRSQINASALQDNLQLQSQQRHSHFIKSNANSKDMFQYLNNRFSSYGTSMKQQLTKWKCPVNNLRQIINGRQPNMLTPTKLATYYGYIRTIDNMYAFGVRTNSSPTSEPGLLQAHNPRESSTWGSFILTRNTSLWVGPFSFTNGAFIYKNVWCLTVDRRLHLTLTKCAKGRANQLFSYTNNVITPGGVAARCACARTSSDISHDVLMMSCSEPNVFKHFKLDVEFIDKCLK